MASSSDEVQAFGATHQAIDRKYEPFKGHPLFSMSCEVLFSVGPLVYVVLFFCMSMPDNVLYIFQEIMMNIYEKECFVSNNSRSSHVIFTFRFHELKRWV